MRAKRYGDFLIQLTRYPVLFPVNVYLVREDDGFTLVDTGLAGSARAILAAAREHGGEIRRIVLTHAHLDHASSLDALRAALPGTAVAIGQREAALLRGELGLAPGEPPSKLRGTYVTSTTRPDRELHPGDHVGSLEVVAAPGHTPGQIALLDRRDRTLIAGDAWQTRGGVAVSGTLVWTFPFPALATWHKPLALASARVLRALEPARLAVGHGAVLGNPLPAMDQAIAVAERQLGEAANYVT